MKSRIVRTVFSVVVCSFVAQRHVASPIVPQGFMHQAFPWWYPVGAQVGFEGTHFRVWAPERRRVRAIVNGVGEVELSKEAHGYFSGFLPGASEGNRYGYEVDGEGPFPDPASRFQPEGPHKFSQIIDPERFQWSDSVWRGKPLEGQVIYEMHIGTFTRAGTYCAALEQLPALVETGITTLEVMPLADFPGKFGWGYDGVNLFAPTRLYGTPDDFREFVDRAHALGLAVILDVVYNHIGPDGNYLPKFSSGYFSPEHKTDWGDAIHFYGPGSEPVREYFSANAAYWIREFHLDGLRLDATQTIYDESPDHILALIARNCRKAAEGRETVLIAENENQTSRLARSPERSGYGLDGLWNDDFHHSAIVAATGHKEAYYSDYFGAPQELISAAKYGYLYQGQYYPWQKKRRGEPTFDLKPAAMVNYIQNHDQVANSGRGLRLDKLTTPGRLRAITALQLLIPGTPMLFQGQEFASSAPFLFFADHDPELAKAVRTGRAEFLSQWRSLGSGKLQYADPCAESTFELCKLDHSERERHLESTRLHADLLRLRREEPVFHRQDRRFDGAVLGEEAFVLRFFGDQPQGDRLLVVNLGRDLKRQAAPEPLLAPPEGTAWQVSWSSEDPQYGGDGTAPVETDAGWTIPGHAAVVLAPLPLVPAFGRRA
jgi:maltooligosyltrehalose trehalohydrolase